MKSIKILAGILKVFGWLSIILGALFLIQAILGETLSLLLGLSNALWFLNGLVFLFLAEGLSKKEKWAWYTALVIFILGLFSVFMEAFLIEFSAGIFLYILIYILLFGLLLRGRQPFIEQPKEKISHWFRKPYFVVVVAGALISTLISGGILAYSVSKRMEVQLPPETIETKPTELTIYKNEKYDFMIEYFTDKLAIERDYETKRLSNNPRLLFDVFFYDSNYGVNAEKTKSIPVVTIEVFECEEEDFNKCYNQIICGPRRYVRGSIASSYGSSYFRIDGLPTNSLSFAWNSQEKMQGTMVIKNQLLYVILVRTGSKNFRPVPEEVFEQVRSTFKLIEIEREVEKGETKAPDLTIENIVWIPTKPKIGEMMQVKIKIKNIGSKSSAKTDISVTDQKGWKNIETVPSLAPGQENIVVLDIYKAEERHVRDNPCKFVVEVDPFDVVKEFDKKDNKTTEEIYIYPAFGCFDSDEGKDYPTRGLVIIPDRYFEDDCKYSSITHNYDGLDEFYCIGDNIGHINVRCSEGCQDGKCLGDVTAPQCIDKDDGENIYKKSEAVDEYGTGQGDCCLQTKTGSCVAEGSYLKEGLCKSNPVVGEGVVTYKIIQCLHSCKDGACVKPD